MTSRSPWRHPDERARPPKTESQPVAETVDRQEQLNERPRGILGDIGRGARNVVIALAVLIVAAIVFDPPAPIEDLPQPAEEGQAEATVMEPTEPEPGPPVSSNAAREQFFETAFPSRIAAENDFCSDQQTIDGSLPAFQKAIGNLVLSQLGIEGTLYAALLRGNRAPPRYKFLNIRSVGVENIGGGRATFRCEADLRVLEEVPDTDGEFSSYVQFNGARYTVKMRRMDTDSPEAFFLAELNPSGGEWDIATGSE